MRVKAGSRGTNSLKAMAKEGLFANGEYDDQSTFGYPCTEAYVVMYIQPSTVVYSMELDGEPSPYVKAKIEEELINWGMDPEFSGEGHNLKHGILLDPQGVRLARTLRALCE